MTQIYQECNNKATLFFLVSLPFAVIMNEFANSFPLALSYISWDTFYVYPVESPTIYAGDEEKMFIPY